MSGISSDTRVLEASTAPQAPEAIEPFCARAAAELAPLTVSLGRLDAIVFTAGIAENSARIRSCISDRLAWTGVALDAATNKNNASRINAVRSDIDVLVLPTGEEAVIAEAICPLTCAGPEPGYT